jgi:hypothetical protein
MWEKNEMERRRQTSTRHYTRSIVILLIFYYGKFVGKFMEWKENSMKIFLYPIFYNSVKWKNEKMME